MEHEAGQQLSLERALKILRRHAWVVVVCLVLTTGAAFGVSQLQKKQYTATASLLFKNPAIAQQASGVEVVSQNDPQGQRETNLRLVTLGNAARTTAAKVGHGFTTQDIRDAIEVSNQGQSNVVSVAATAGRPTVAADIANTFTREFIREQTANDQATIQNAIALVQQQLAALSPAQQQTTQGQALKDRIESLQILKAAQATTQLVHEATVPDSPSSPKVVRNTVAGAILGLLIGLALAFLIDRLDRRLREPNDVEDAFGMPLLGLVPHGDRPLRSRVGSGADTPEIDLEPFRMLRAHLRYFNVDRELKTILVTSVAPSEGKTTVARNLATAAASMGTATLLVEADLRRPTLARDLGLEPGPGLGGALVNHDAPFSAAVQHVSADSQANGHGARRLDILVAGAVPPNPAELLESHAMENLLQWARQAYELVIVDTPPLSVVSDAIALIRRVDGVIVVSRLGQSTRDGAQRLRRRLESLGSPVLGVVANDLRARKTEYGYYGYGDMGPLAGDHALAHPEPISDDPADPEVSVEQGSNGVAHGPEVENGDRYTVKQRRGGLLSRRGRS